MRMPVIARRPSSHIILWLAFLSAQASAAIDSAGILDTVLQRYSDAASTWGTVITNRASWLFWTLVVISLVITFGFMALRKADIGEFYAEFVRFTLFTGFFWWALTNGPHFATSIMNSLRMVASEASGTPNVLTPSGIVNIGFDIFWKVLDQSTVWKPVDSAAGMVMGGAVLIMLTLVGVNMLLLLISGWILAYAGVFALGFGGSRWTSDIAITYYKSVLNIGLQLMAMILLVGIGKGFIDQYYAGMSAGMNLKELSVMVVAALVLLILVKTVPGLVGGLAGGNVGSLGSGFGVGAVMGAAAMAGAAAATAGAAIAAGATGAAGGMQALMAAFSKASAAESAGGGAGSMLAAAGSGGDGGGGVGGGGAAANDAGGGSPLASAMGDGGSSSGSSSGSGGAGSSGGSGGSAGLGGGTSLDGSASLDGAGSSGSDASGADQSSSAGSKGAGEQAAAARGGNKDGAAGEAKQGGFGAKAARAGRIAAGTATNLAAGTWDVTKGKAAELRKGAMDRIGETTGGKIAAAINARAAADKAAKFGDDSLSAAADDKAVDAASEVAAFRDRDSKAS